MKDEFEAIFCNVPCPLSDDFSNALDSNIDLIKDVPSAGVWFDLNAAYMCMSV